MRCYEIAISVLCLKSPDLFTYAVNGSACRASGRWGMEGQLSWKETHCFLLVFPHTCVYYVHSHRFYGPSKYNAANSWSSPKMSSIIFWWGLVYFSQNCGRRPGLRVTVTVHRDTGETFDLTPVNRWHRCQLLLSWQTHPVSADDVYQALSVVWCAWNGWKQPGP